MHKTPYQLLINNFFLQCQVATTLHPSCLKNHLPSSSFMLLFELETIRNIYKLIFTLTIHLLYQFRSVLPLHRNHPVDLQSKLMGWFLYNGYTANSRHHLFHISYLTWLKTFLTPFPKCSTKPELFHKSITEKLPNNSHKQFYDD